MHTSVLITPTSSPGIDNIPFANCRESQVQLKPIKTTILFRHYNFIPPNIMHSYMPSPYFLPHNKHMRLFLPVLLKTSHLSWLRTALNFKPFFLDHKSWMSLLASNTTMKSVHSCERYLAPAVISLMVSHMSFEGLPVAKKI